MISATNICLAYGKTYHFLKMLTSSFVSRQTAMGPDWSQWRWKNRLFSKILAGESEADKGAIFCRNRGTDRNVCARITLRFDEHSVIDTVMMGTRAAIQSKKPNVKRFTPSQSSLMKTVFRSGELEAEFAEMKRLRSRIGSGSATQWSWHR